MHRPPSDHSLKLLGTLAGAAMLGGFAIPAQAEEPPVPQSAPQPEGEKPPAAKPAPEKPAAAPEAKPAKPAAEKPAAVPAPEVKPAPAKPDPAPPVVEKPAPPKVEAPKPAEAKPEPAPAAPAVKPEVEKPAAAKPVPEKPAAAPEAKPAPVAPAPVDSAPTAADVKPPAASTDVAPAPSPAKPTDTAPVPSTAPGPANPDQGGPVGPRAEGNAPAPEAPQPTPVPVVTVDASPDGAASDEKAPGPKPVPPTAEPAPLTGTPAGPAGPADAQPTPDSKPAPAVPPVGSQGEGPVNAAEVPVGLPDDPPGIPTVETIESLPTPPVAPTASPSPEPVVEPSATPSQSPVAPVSGGSASDDADGWVKPTVSVKPARPSVRPEPTTRPDDDTLVRPAKPRPKPSVPAIPSVPSEPVLDESDAESDDSSGIDEVVEPPVTPISAPTEDVIPSTELPGPLPEPDDPIPAISSAPPAPSSVTGELVAGPRVSIDEAVEQRPPMSGLIPVVELAPTLAESHALFTETESADLVGPDGSPSPEGQRASRVVLRDVVSHLAVAQQSVAGFTPVEMADMDASRPIDADLIAVRYRVGEGETLHQIAGQLFALDVLDVETVEEAYQLLLTINELDQDAKVASGDEVLVPLSRSRLVRAKESLDLTGDGLWTLRVDATKRIVLDRREALPDDSEERDAHLEDS